MVQDLESLVYGSGLRAYGLWFSFQGSRSRVQDLGSMVYDSGFRVYGLWFRVEGRRAYGSRFRVHGLWLRVEGPWFMVQGLSPVLGFRIWGSGC